MARAAVGAWDVEILVDKKDVDRHMRAIEDSLRGNSMMLFHQLATQQILRNRARERFAKEGDAVSGRWARLLDSTQDIREHAGYGPAHPINKRTGELENYITNGNNQFTYGADFANFFMPGRGSRTARAKLATAQGGRPAGGPMPDGWGGTKPSPSPTVPRPVIGMDAVDLAHVVAAFPIWLGAEVAKRL